MSNAEQLWSGIAIVSAKDSESETVATMVYEKGQLPFVDIPKNADTITPGHFLRRQIMTACERQTDMDDNDDIFRLAGLLNYVLKKGHNQIIEVYATMSDNKGVLNTMYLPLAEGYLTWAYRDEG